MGIKLAKVQKRMTRIAKQIEKQKSLNETIATEKVKQDEKIKSLNKTINT